MVASKLARKMERETFTFTGWKYSHYFYFIGKKDDKNIIVRCKLCVRTKTLSTAKNTTSNLLKHLLRQHISMPLVEVQPSNKSSMAVEDACSPVAKQPKLDFSHGQQPTTSDNIASNIKIHFWHGVRSKVMMLLLKRVTSNE